MKRPIAVLALIFGLSMALPAQEKLVEVDFKVFPQEYRLSLRGLPQAPVKTNDTVRTYKLPQGPVAVSLSAQGFIPKSIRFDVPPTGVQIAEKLEPKDGPLTFVGEQTTGRLPRSVAFTPDGKFLIVPLFAGKGAEVFAVPGLEKKTTLAPPDGAERGGFADAAVLAVGQEIWLTQQSTHSVHVFDLKTLAYKSSFSSGQSGSKFLLVLPGEDFACVSNWDSDNVTVLDVRTKAVVKDIYVGGIPRGLALSPDRSTLYVSLFDAEKIVKIRLKDLVKEGVVESPGAAFRPAAASRDRLFFGDMASGRLLILAPANDRILGRPHIGSNPNNLFADPTGNFLFAVTRGRNNPQDYTLPGPEFGRLLMLSPQTGEILASVWGRHQPTGLAVSSDGRWVAFTDYLDDKVELYYIKGL